ncbi:hypothetical protein ScPMuIL_006979 [Solemya velum]
MRLFEDDEDTRMSWDCDDDGFNVDSPSLSEQSESRFYQQSGRLSDDDSGLGMEIDMKDDDDEQPEIAFNEDEILRLAMHKHLGDPDLIGDGSMGHKLPTIPGKHHDLKSITPETLSEVIQGGRGDVNRYAILDCRYPYEYDGGHIVGARNVCTEDDLLALLDVPMASSGGQRPILIFHCEFSSERAPKLCRLLRRSDRKVNSDHYPFLIYPEVYILDGGYSNFFRTHEDFCEPQTYIPMLHKDYASELRDFRDFRRKSKSRPSKGKRFQSSLRLQF